MKEHPSTHPIPAPHRVHPSIGTAVHCIHCYRELGEAANARQRAQLANAHHCSEGLLAKRPASPPPYN